MKRHLKKQLMELVGLLSEAHENLVQCLNKGDIDSAVACLLDCQNTAIAVGQRIDESEGEGTTSVKALEEYCELIFQIYNQLINGESYVVDKLYKKLRKSYFEITNRMQNDLPEVKEVVFLPYKASMWDSLETVWKKADADPGVEAKVIPIPYYDINPDGSYGEMHYEGNEFPGDVPVISYEKYNLESNHPDEIYIHNPYDDNNLVTSIHPFFYSKNLKKYTDKLVYIPYFVLEEPDSNNKCALEGMKHFVQLPAVFNADEVIVQSENMRKAYIECMVMYAGEESREYYEKKIKGTGSPKIEKIKSMTMEDVTLPEEWKKYIYKSDGSRKKIIVYNTSLTAFLQNPEQMLKKILDVFKVFDENRDEVALLWRPHPLLKTTISSMRPQLAEAYDKIVKYYTDKEIGIYDDTADLDRALVMADAYYGDPSSLVTLCKAIKMPIMIQNAMVISEGGD